MVKFALYMRTLFENKRLILILAALALLALTVLAISLNNTPFRAAQHFGQDGTEKVSNAPQELITEWIAIPWWKELGIWILMTVLVILGGALLSPELRKQLIRRFIRLALTFWALFYILKNYRQYILPLNMDLAQKVPVQNSNGSTGRPAVFQPPHISPTFSYLISFGFALLALAVIWALYRGWQKYTAMLNSKAPLNEIGRIARSCLDDLSSGRDSSDVIINCYLRMSDVVFDKRKLYRADAMTPNEFASRLQQAGLPGEAVTRLTRLFERVRYGERKSRPK